MSAEPPRKQARTEASTGKPQDLHAHWDCSRGASASAMLAACFRSAENSSPNGRKEWLNELQVLVLRIFKGIINDFSLDVEELGDSSMKVKFLNYTVNESVKSVSWESLLDGFIIRCEDVPAWVKEYAALALKELSKAEKSATKLENWQMILFSLEIVVTLWCLDRLGVRSISYGPLPMSFALPMLPGKAMPVAHRLMMGMDVIPFTGMKENGVPDVTETAAALLKVLSKTCPSNQAPTMTLRSIASGQDIVAAELRMILTLGEPKLGESMESRPWEVEKMITLEANIDDMTPEHLSFCVDRLLQEGAADAWTVPIVMKKGRLAHTLHCLGRYEQRDSLLRVMFRHSGTLGVRMLPADRAALARTMVPAELEHGRVNVKFAYLDEELVSAKAEFDDCKKISISSGLTIQSVAEQATRKARLHQAAREAALK